MPKYTKNKQQEFLNYINEIAKDKHITQPIANHLKEFVFGYKRNTKKSNLPKYLEIAKNLKEHGEKAKTLKAFKSWTPPNAYLQIQVFKMEELKNIRKTSRQHKQHKTVTVPADDYIIVNRAYYIGDASMSGISNMWKYVKINIPDYNKLIKSNIVVHKGETQKIETMVHFWKPFINCLKDAEVKLYIERIAESNSIFVVVRGFQVAKPFNGKLRNAEWVEVEKSSNDKKLIHKYLQFDIDKTGNSIDTIFKTNKYFVNNSCLPNAIMNAWADKFNSKYKTKELSYEVINKLVFGVAEHEGKMSFQQAKKVFKYVRQAAYLYNEFGKELTHYHPEDDGLKVDTFLGGSHGMPLRLILKDNHVYRISNKDCKKSIALTEFKEEELKEPNNHYMQIQLNKQSMGTCYNIDDAIIKSKPFIGEADDEIIRHEYVLNSATENLVDFYLKLKEVEYVPNVHFNSFMEVKRLSIKLNNCSISFIPVNFGTDTITTQSMREMTDEEAKEYQTLNTYICSQFTQTKYRSTYSNDFKDVMKHFNRCPESLTFEYDENMETLGIDNIKCYPSIVAKQIKHIPVFGKFDIFEKREVYEIDDLSLYIVKQKKNYPKDDIYKVIMNKSVDLLYGFELNEIKEYVSILAVNTPHKLIKNDLHRDIKSVFDNKIISEAHKKQILNSAIGKWGVLSKTAEKSVIYDDEEDANRNKGMNEIIPINLNNTFLYVVHCSKKTELINGFLPIQALVYAHCRMRVFNLIKSLNVKVLGVKTDCVFFKKEDRNKIEIVDKATIKGDDYNNIGKWGVCDAIMPQYQKLTSEEVNIWWINNFSEEGKKSNPVEGFYDLVTRADVDYNVIRDSKFALNWKWIKSPVVPKIHKLKDEYKIDEVLNILNKRLFIQGAHAGSGKSQMCADIIKHMNDSHFIACPQNPQALKWKKLKFEAGTLYDLCGKRLNDDGDVQNITSHHEEYKIVIFEEIGQYTTYDFEMIEEYMALHPDTIYIANGDQVQNEPIENLSVDGFKYYTNIINTLFNTQVFLEIPKRYKDKATANKAEQIKYDLFINGLSPNEVLMKNAKKINIENIPKNAICLAYLQDTRRKVNEFMHYKYGEGGKYYEGLKLKANTRMDVVNDKIKCYIYKNFEYIIKSYEKTETILYDPLSEKCVTIWSCQLKNFSYCHAHTGHSFQGETVKAPIVIFDRKHYFVSSNWMYPALTRNKYLEIYYCDDECSLGLEDNYIKTKIENYKVQDVGRDINNYIDIDYVKKISHRQKHRCLMCKECMNFNNADGDGLNWVVDRIDNNKGHIKGNVQLLCFNCNSRKK